MEIILADGAGFCFGVRRAVDIVLAAAKDDGSDKIPIYTLGPIIHNPQMVEHLKGYNVNVINHINDIKNIEHGAVIIRSHGVALSMYSLIKENKLKVIDATCPYVKRIHTKVYKSYKNGYRIIIVGDENHPEVIGINGWCDNKAIIINGLHDIKDISKEDKYCVVVQTTFNKDIWDDIAEEIEKRTENALFFNTICSATYRRQKKAARISKKVDVMLIIGGKNSSNTKKLYEICKMNCDKTYLIETAEEINFTHISRETAVGVTAGASTPDWIIKEVIKKMTEYNDDLSKELEERKDETEAGLEAKEEESRNMNSFDSSLPELKKGDIVEGTVIMLKDDEVVVNIGYKSDGIIPKKELQESEDDIKPGDVFSIGDTIKTYVMKVNDKEGLVLLSKKKVDMEVAWADLQKNYENNEIIEAPVKEVVKGGIISSIAGIKIFIPASHVDIKYVEDLSQFVGQTIRYNIIEFNKYKNKVVGSRQVLLEQEQNEKQEKIWNSISEGQRITGVVNSITDFGVFVDIGGMDGLIHISDLSWAKVKHPSDVLSEGEHIEVEVLSVNKEKGRISLGYKQTKPHPWDNIEQRYKIGTVVKGKIVRIAPFGAFVELENGVDALLHISQIAHERINKVEEVLKAGDEIEAKIVDINPEEQRISLSVKELIDEPKPVEKAKKAESKFIKEDMLISLGELFTEKNNKN